MILGVPDGVMGYRNLRLSYQTQHLLACFPFRSHKVQLSVAHLYFRSACPLWWGQGANGQNRQGTSSIIGSSAGHATNRAWSILFWSCMLSWQTKLPNTVPVQVDKG